MFKNPVKLTSFNQRSFALSTLDARGVKRHLNNADNENSNQERYKRTRFLTALYLDIPLNDTTFDVLTIAAALSKQKKNDSIHAARDMMLQKEEVPKLIYGALVL